MSLYWISSNFGRTQNLHKGSVPLVTYSTGPSKLQFSSFLLNSVQYENFGIISIFFLLTCLLIPIFVKGMLR